MDQLKHFFTRLNVWVYQISNGHIGSKLGIQSVLLLYSIGRKSGKKRTTTLSYYRDGENYLVVGSNWGKESHPDWYYNLVQQPRAQIQVGSTTINIEAHQAGEDEYDRLWQLVIRNNTQYIQYQQRTKRRIPIMVLTPIHPG